MTGEAHRIDAAMRARAVEAAQGLRPFDLAIENARLPCLVTGRERRVTIGICGALTSCLCPAAQAVQAKERLDAQGAFALPGLIDTHMHIESSMMTPAEYARAMVPRGVTTLVWDPHEFANVCGLAGVGYALAASTGLPMRVLCLAPGCVPSAPGYESGGGDFDARTIATLLQNPAIHGTAELMTMRPLLSGDARVTAIANAALASGKRLCGHARGLEGGDFAAYMCAGVSTDHELGGADDLLARLEAGMTVELRGSHEHLLAQFAAALVAIGHLPQNLTLCTDDVFPDDLAARGGLDHVLRKLIECGLPPLWAFRAATLNAATQIGRPDLGLIAPGRRADIALFSDLEDVRCDAVIVGGRPCARDGKLMCPPKTLPPPPPLLNTVRTGRFCATDFEVQAPGPRARLRTLCRPRFPVWGEREVAVRAGKLSLPDDLILMAVANRYGSGAPVRLAVLEKWGRWRCAFATTVSHDCHNLTVFGRDPHDMALAANTVREAQGGLCVARGGKVLAKVELPLAGLVSDRPLEDVARALGALRQALDSAVEWEPPLLVFKALFGASLVCNSGPRLSDVGIVDVFEGQIVSTPLIDDQGDDQGAG